MELITHKYKEMIVQMVKKSRSTMEVSHEDVYQEGNKDILPIIDTMIGDHLLPGSEIRGWENLDALMSAAESGKSCMLLVEHYSNFDLPVLHYLLRKRGQRGQAIADALIAIAGIKLNESNPVVLAFTEAYSRIVIYPSRSLESMQKGKHDPRDLVAEMVKSATINRAAMKTLAEKKKSGKIILVFPAGTRFRPWEPNTKRGVREIDSYLKSFDCMVLMSVNGSILRINPDGEMQEDLVEKDRVVYDVSPVELCDDFREAIKHAVHFGDDRKQAIVDAIMRRLEAMHESVAKAL